MNKKTLKSIWAILAGFLTVALLSIATDFVLEKIGIFPSATDQMKYGPATWLLVVALLYRSVYTVLGGYVTARLAPSRPMKHVVILGSIGTIMAILGVIGGWNLSAHWYPIALAVTAFPLVWLGGKLKTGKTRD